MAARHCTTCSQPCYPTEKIMISELWVHKQGCLKCSVCSTTLSLSSVYVAPSPISPFARQLFCAKDVPKIVHTSIVDSLALKTAMNAPNPTTVPKGAFATKKPKNGKGKTIRFKGLTIRSRSIKAGLEAPKLDLKGLGMMRKPVIVGHAPGTPLDHWDIVHAMNVQNQISSPIQDHPAIHAQRTGSSANQWPMPSQPVTPQLTGALDRSNIAKAGRAEREVQVEADLVKNLIKVFQLDVVDKVEISRTPFPTPARPTRSPTITHEKEETDVEMTPRFEAYHPTISMKGSIKYIGDLLDIPAGTIRTITTLGSRRGTKLLDSLNTIGNGSGNCSTVGKRRTPLSEKLFINPSDPPIIESVSEAESVEIESNQINTAKAMKLLEALLPLAAHLIPLPGGGEDELDEVVLTRDNEVDKARDGLVRNLEEEGMELVMLFEEEPEPVDISA